MIACCSMLPSYNQKGGSHCCCCSFRFLRRQSVGINIISDISTTSICRAGGNLVTSAAACCVPGPAVQNFIETRFASASIALQKLEQSVTTMTDETTFLPLAPCMMLQHSSNFSSMSYLQLLVNIFYLSKISCQSDIV